MSELLRPVFEAPTCRDEILRQREIAAAYLGEVSVALCNVNVEYNHAIQTILGLNLQLRESGDGA